jgi:hypothetical protein
MQLRTGHCWLSTYAKAFRFRDDDTCVCGERPATDVSMSLGVERAADGVASHIARHMPRKVAESVLEATAGQGPAMLNASGSRMSGKPQRLIAIS